MVEVCSMIDELYKLANHGETLKTAVLQVERCQRLAIQNDDSKISVVIQTRKLCYRKDDRAMRAI